MSTAFDDIRLPEDVEQGAKGGSHFQTSIIALASGVEQRVGNWEQAKAPWDIGYGISNMDDLKLVENFFHGRRGRLRAFRFKDWHDFAGVDEVLGTGDGSRKTFLLVKTYPDAANAYVRRITRPVAGTVTVKVDGTLVSAANYDVHVAGGYIVFHNGFAPIGGGVVTASYEFDIPVRFDIDDLGMVVYWIKAGEIPSIPIVEIRDVVNVAPSVALTNVVATLADGTSTASRVRVADVVITDDPFGEDTLALSGADAATFELFGTLTIDGTGVSVYLKAGTVLDGVIKPTYNYNVDVRDSMLGSAVQNTVAGSLAITNTARAPQVALTGLNASFPWNQNVSSAIKVATVNVTQHGTLGTNTITLSGANAASFHFGTPTSGSGGYTCDLFINSGVATPVDSNPANAISYTVTVNVSNGSFASPPQDSKSMTVVFGVGAGTTTDSTPGTRGYVVPEYQTLVIKGWGAGAGASGINAVGGTGGATGIAAMSLNANGGQCSPTILDGDFNSEGGLGGTATGGDINTAGATGGPGLFKKSPAATTVSSGAGGAAPGSGGAGGAPATASAPTTPSPLSQPAPPASTADTANHVSGNAGVVPGGGGSGSASMLWRLILTLADGYTWYLYAIARPGAGSGGFFQKTFVRGVTPGAPVPGTTITYTIGAGAAGGADSASGGAGANGRMQFVVS